MRCAQVWPLGTLLAAAFLAPALIATPVLAGGSTTVVGQNDAAVDRINLQAAIDAAPDGGKIDLEGIFQLDGAAISISRSLRLRGPAIDNDDDGEVDEDPADGIDNDGDGALDEDGWDAEIRGLVDVAGEPLPEVDRTIVFNRAIFVRGLDGVIDDVRIEGIRFSGHFRAITIEPDTGSTGGTVCENLFSTSGRLEDLRIERNRFDNNDRAVEIEGATRNARVKDNLVEDTSNIAIIVQGLQQGCPLIGGGFGTFPAGQPIDTRVEGNAVTGTGLGALFNFGAVATRVKDNLFEAGNVGLFSDGDAEAEIKDNDFIDVSFAIDVLGSGVDATIKDNRITGGLFAIFLDLDARGWEVKGNTFTDVLFGAVFLDPSSSENTVKVGPNDTVFDLGVDNEIIIE